MTSPLELLPLFILESISEYLDDQSATRPSLRAFSLASKSCYGATEAQRFSQIELKVKDPQYLQSTLTRWNDILDGGKQRHVRRLKISPFETEEDVRIAKSRGLRRPKDDLDEGNRDEQRTRPYFYLHDYCRPSHEDIWRSGYGIQNPHSQSWVALSHFIRGFPGLQDLVWSVGNYIPPSVLSVSAERGIRLHVHHFHIRSLVQVHDELRPVSAEEYALCTLPTLNSITVRASPFGSGGTLNYMQDAVMQMIAGLAPGLKHLCIVPIAGFGELDPGLDQAIARGKPEWKGFFPGQIDSSKQRDGDTARSSSRGKLRSLIFPSHVPNGIEYWSRHTDFSYLQSLVMSWGDGSGIHLAAIAARGDLRSLKKLNLSSIDAKTEASQSALDLLFSSLNPLERLETFGHITPATFSIISRQHGPELRALIISPGYAMGEDGPRSLLASFSGPVLEELAAHSPYLTHLDIPINRTRGDKTEVAIYRALSKFPRLEHVDLRLEFRVTPDRDHWDEERDGPHPLDNTDGEASNIPSEWLQEAFSNSAINEKLARSIFEVIAGGEGRSTPPTLRYLRLWPYRQMRYYDIGHASDFGGTLIWFNRQFVCKRDGQAPKGVMVQDTDLAGLAAGEEQWKYMADTPNEDLWYGEEKYVTAFKALWPQKTEEWWRDWESLPLDLGE